METATRVIRRLRMVPQRLRSRRQVKDFERRHPDLGRVIAAARAKGLTYLYPENLVDLAEAVLDAERRELPGAILEAGTALGGSAIVMARAKRPERPMAVFDAFGMIPPPTDADGPDVHARYEEIVSGGSRGIKGAAYYGYRDDLLAEVAASFTAFGVEPDANNVRFVKGYYETTMPGAVTIPVAVAHLDCDWYESVMTCLREIEPQVVPGGRFVIDDYDAWSGCAKAVDEFFAGRTDYRWEQQSRLHLVKQPG